MKRSILAIVALSIRQHTLMKFLGQEGVYFGFIDEGVFQIAFALDSPII